jgi:hypothetical protein
MEIASTHAFTTDNFYCNYLPGIVTDMANQTIARFSVPTVLLPLQSPLTAGL